MDFRDETLASLARGVQEDALEKWFLQRILDIVEDSLRDLLEKKNLEEMKKGIQGILDALKIK